MIRPPPRPTLFPYTTLFRSHLTEEVPVVEVGDNHLFAFIVLNQYGDGASNNVVQRVAFITGVNNSAFGRLATSMTVGEKRFYIFYMRWQCEGGQGEASEEYNESLGGGC